MPSSKARTLAGGPPASRQQSAGDAQGQRDRDQLQKAIKDIKAYLAIIGLLGKTKDVWEHVQKAGEVQVEALQSTSNKRKGDVTA